MGAGMAKPGGSDSGRSVNPISTRWTKSVHLIRNVQTLRKIAPCTRPPRFSDLPPSLGWNCKIANRKISPKASGATTPAKGIAGGASKIGAAASKFNNH